MLAHRRVCAMARRWSKCGWTTPGDIRQGLPRSRPIDPDDGPQAGPSRDQFTSTVTRHGSTGAPHGISGGQTSRYEVRPPRPGRTARYAAAVVPGGGGAGSGRATKTSPLAWTGVHQLYGLGYRTWSTASVTYSRCHRRRQMVRPLSACPSWIGRPVASVGTQPVGAGGSAGAAELADAGVTARAAATTTAAKRVLARTKPPPVQQPTYPPESIFRRTSLKGQKGRAARIRNAGNAAPHPTQERPRCAAGLPASPARTGHRAGVDVVRSWAPGPARWSAERPARRQPGGPGRQRLSLRPR